MMPGWPRCQAMPMFTAAWADTDAYLMRFDIFRMSLRCGVV